MKTRATLALAVAAGLPAAVSAQESFVVSYSVQEVTAGSATPSAVQDGLISPGEGARITVTVRALLANGSSAIGANTTYPPPNPPGGNGSGVIRGLGSVVYDILGDLGAASAAGAWSQTAGPLNAGANPPPANSAFNNALSGGTIPLAPNPTNGSMWQGFGGAQVIAPGGTARGDNNNVRVFVGTWTPASYATRTVNFKATASNLVPTTPAPGQHNSVLVAYGQATDIDPNTFEVFTYDLYLGKYLSTNFGNGVNLNVVPAPSSLALLGLGALVAGGRRRK
jgi:hypothetical protein